MFDAGVNDKPCKSEPCTSFQDQHSLFMRQVKHYDVRKQQQTRSHSSMTNGYSQNRVRIYSRNRPGGSISNDIREGTNVRESERSRQNYSDNQHSQTPKQDRSKNYHGGFISNNVRCERNFQENYRSHQNHSRNHQQEYISEQHNQPNEWQLISLNHAIPCAGCGDKNHSRLECPVTNKNTICNYCKINGHLEKACLKLSRRRIFEVYGRPMENPPKIHEPQPSASNNPIFEQQENGGGWEEFRGSSENSWEQIEKSADEWSKNESWSETPCQTESEVEIDNEPEIEVKYILSSTDISTLPKQAYTYDRFDMRGFRDYFSPQQWITILKQKSEEAKKNGEPGWDIDQAPFELDAELRCLFSQQLIVQREREKAERKRIQEEQQKEKERLEEIRKEKMKDVVFGRLKTENESLKAENWFCLDPWFSRKKFEQKCLEERKKLNKAQTNGTLDMRPYIYPRSTPEEFDVEIQRAKKLLDEDNTRRKNDLQEKIKKRTEAQAAEREANARQDGESEKSEFYQNFQAAESNEAQKEDAEEVYNSDW